jgi:hypothetical protein
MASSNDDPDVIMFMARFHALHDLIGDNVDSLYLCAGEEAPLKEACLLLFEAGALLSAKERGHPQLFEAPVNPAFVSAWREYQERFWWPLSRLSLMDVFDVDLGDQPTGNDRFDQGWERANQGASDDDYAISEAIRFAEIGSDPANDDLYPKEYLEEIRGGISTWKYFHDHIGLNIKEVFRRRDLCLSS